MDISVECPQCGAEVDLAEEDTVFKCLYCGSILKPTGRNRVQSFFVAPRQSAPKVGKVLIRALNAKLSKHLHIVEHHLLYAPYWRVHGMIFQWVFGRRYFKTASGDKSWEDLKKLRATPWVYTFPAFDASKWGLFSLGLRVQALKIWPFNKKKMGEDLLLMKQTVSYKEAVGHSKRSITKHSGSGSFDVEMEISELVGERYSLLFFPFYSFTLQNNGKKSEVLVDGLSHKVINGHVDLHELKKYSSADKIPYKPLSFIPFKCPNCGWEFSFRPRTIIHFCKSCAQAWLERGGSYVPVPYKISVQDSGPKTGCTYLAFWKLSAVIKTPEREYSSRKEFYELFPLPRILDEERIRDRDISFYIPAFRIKNVPVVDKFAARLTQMQPDFKESDPDAVEELDLSDVWLPLKEAKEMAHILLYSLTRETHKRTKKVVKTAELRFSEAKLLCLPFLEKGIYFRELQTDLALQKKALDLD
jgi:ribosomal protein S27E